MVQDSKLRRLSALPLCATLILSGLIFMPYAQHVFWAPESFSTRFLAPLALVLVAYVARKAPAWPARAWKNPGLLLLLLLIGSWLLSAALAARADLAWREL